jgi:integrase
VSQRITEYLSEIEKQNYRTARVFGSHLRDFDKFNDGKTDEAIELLKSGKMDVYELLKSFAGYLLNKGTLSGKSVRYSVKTARRFLEFYDVDISTRKFHIKVKLPKALKIRPAALSKPDVVKIINSLPDIRAKTYVMFLASTGCRAEEALSITMGDLDLAKNPATAHIDGNFTKTKEERYVWLTEEVKRQLQIWIEYKYRERTIKSRDSNGKWVKRDIEPVQGASDFVFLPYGNQKPDNLHKLKNMLHAQRILKNSYYPLYDAFKAAMSRVGYPKVTFHSMRRYVYTVIDGLGHNQFAEFYLGHANSEYWAKPEAEKVKTFKAVEPYLLLLDIEALEARGATVESKLKASEERYHKLQEQTALMMRYVTEPDPAKKDAIAREMIERGYLPKSR